MSDNDSNNIKNEISSNSRNDEFKYYYENESGNVSYEDIDTFAHSRGREINEINNTNFVHEQLNNLINLRTNNIISSNPITNNIIINLDNHNRPIHHLSHSFITHRNNIFDNSNINSDSNENNNGNNLNSDTQIDDIYDQLTFAISTEKQNLKNDKACLLKEKKKFIDLKKSEMIKLQREREQWIEKIRIGDKYKAKETDILDLDIGGAQKITTTRGTLMKYPNSALANLFSGRHQIKTHNGKYFLDRDGNVFVNLINFLRSGKIPVFKTKTDEIAFLDELEFWQIDLKQNDESLFSFDPEWVANTLVLDNSNTIVKKQNLNHGIVFLNTPLDIYNNYVEFRVIMNIPSRGKNHLFIGLVDKSKYKYELLMSTFWKDNPSSFYWDVWNSKIIKTDENGMQTSSQGGYGCQCEEYETKISMQYDYKNKTISFGKNGVDQGIAFRNVPNGLTPSLDLWFESGTIEILNTTKNIDKIYL